MMLKKLKLEMRKRALLQIDDLLARVVGIVPWSNKLVGNIDL